MSSNYDELEKLKSRNPNEDIINVESIQHEINKIVPNSELELPLSNLNRSKTDTDIEIKKYKCNIIPEKLSKHSKSTHQIQSSLPSCSNHKKIKSYNPTEARKYMKEQRSKRMAAGTADIKSNNRKDTKRDEINKRLLELREKTRKILERNVKVAKKLKKQEGGENGNKNILLKKQTLKDPREPKQQKQQLSQRQQQKLSSDIKQSSHSNKSEMKKSISKPKEMLSNRRTGISEEKYSIPEISNFDTKPELRNKLPFSSRSMKESIFLSPLPDMDIYFATNRNSNLSEKTPLLPTKPELYQDEIMKKIQQNKVLENYDLILITPKTQLRNQNVFEEKSIQVDFSSPPTTTVTTTTSTITEVTATTSSSTMTTIETTKTSATETMRIPSHWLGTTAVQTYPYNFITAVRTKLEAVTAKTDQSGLNTTKISQHKIIRKSSTSSLSVPNSNEALISSHTINNNDSKRNLINCANSNSNSSSDKSSRKYDNSSFSSLLSEIKSSIAKGINTRANIESLNEPIYSNKATNESSVSMSELSSISVNIPSKPNTDHQMKTISEISSIKSDSIHVGLSSHHQQQQQQKLKLKNSNNKNILENYDIDDTTVSSSVFSSPEKQQKKSSTNSNHKSDHMDSTHNIKNQQQNHKYKIQSETMAKNQHEYDLIIPSISIVKPSTNLDNFSSEENNNKRLHSISNRNNNNNNSNDFNSNSEKISNEKGINDSNFEQFFEDFNKSLSQAIEVNEHIKTGTAHHNINSNSNHKSEYEKSKIMDTFSNDTKIKTDLYSTDFDEESNNYQHKLSTHNTDSSSNSRKNISNSTINTGTINKTATINSNSSIIPTITISKHFSNNNSDSKFSNYIKSNGNEISIIDDNNDVNDNFEFKTSSTPVSSNENRNLNDFNKTKKNKNSTSIEELCYSNSNTFNSNSVIEDENERVKNANSSLSEKVFTSSEIEIVIEENSSSNKDCTNKFSSKSMKSNKIKNSNKATIIPSTSDYFQTHINTTRGNNFDKNKTKHHDNDDDLLCISKSKYDNKNNINIPPPEYSSFKLCRINSNSSIVSVDVKITGETAAAAVTVATNTTMESDGKDTRKQTPLNISNSDKDLSVISFLDNTSEISLNYSTIGQYEKLLKNESEKTEYLAIMLKIREKILIDRTKSQIAWLEVQKEKCKLKGSNIDISAIKKKQRAILLKMEKEKEEIKRLIKTHIQKPEKSIEKNKIQPKFPEEKLNILFRKNSISNDKICGGCASSSSKGGNNDCSNNSSFNTTVVRGYELEGCRSLEMLLRNREEQIKKRREAVIKLLEWHRRLDEEERDIFEMEKMLFNLNTPYQTNNNNNSNTSNNNNNNQHHHYPQNNNNELSLPQDEISTQQRINKIDKKLKRLKYISEKSDRNKIISNSEAINELLEIRKKSECIRLTGKNLNLLWETLTGHTNNKFNTECFYKVDLKYLEKFYEDAKQTLLNDLATNNHQNDVTKAPQLVETTTESAIESSQLDSSPSLIKLNEFNKDKLKLKGNNINHQQEQVKTGTDNTISPSSNSTLTPESISNNEESSVSLSQKPSNSSISENISKYSKTEKNSEQEQKYENNSVIIKSDENLSINNTSRNCNDTILNSNNSNTIATSICDEINSEKSSNKSENSVEEKISIADTNGINQISSIKSNSIGEELYSENFESTITGTGSKISNHLTTSEKIYSNIKKNLESKLNTILSEQIENNSNESNNTILSVSSSVFNVEENSSIQEENSNSRNSSEKRSIETKSSHDSRLNQEQIINSNPSNSYNSNSNENANSNIKNSISTECDVVQNEYSENQDKFTSSSSSQSPMKSSVTIHSNSISNSASSTMRNSSINNGIIQENCEKSNGSVSQSENEHKTSENKEMNSEIINTNENTKMSNESNNTSYRNCTFDEDEEDDDELITDISLPMFESTTYGDDDSSKFENSEEYKKTDQEQQDQMKVVENSNDDSLYSKSPNNNNNNELKQRLIHIGESLVELQHTFEKALSPEGSPRIPPPPPQRKDEKQEQLKQQSSKLTSSASVTTVPTNSISSVSINSASALNSVTPKTNNSHVSHMNATNTINSNVTIRNYLAYSDASLTAGVTTPTVSSLPATGFIPDVMNEVDLCRRQRIFENEIRQLEHEMPYVFLREIPNKPPPPYVPPAHGSPMTAIFPSEQRIQEITFRRIEELYEEIISEHTHRDYNKTDSILSENITNIYERIILDICKEKMNELKPSITDVDSNNYKHPLVLFNPPDRLKCIQSLIYKYIRKLYAMDKKSTSTTTSSSSSFCHNYKTCSPICEIYNNSRKKCVDHVDEILISELYDDEQKWTNFDLEEEEVKKQLIEKVCNKNINEIIDECVTDYQNKISPEGETTNHQ